MNTDSFFKFKNSLDIEFKLIIRCKATLILLLCSLCINAFEFLYILPYDRIMGNSIALSSWITQIHIILGVAFGIIIYDKETFEVKELTASLSATFLKKITKSIVVFFHAVVIYIVSSAFAFFSLFIQGADFLFIYSVIRYIGIYWILP